MVKADEIAAAKPPGVVQEGDPRLGMDTDPLLAVAGRLASIRRRAPGYSVGGFGGVVSKPSPG